MTVSEYWFVALDDPMVLVLGLAGIGFLAAALVVGRSAATPGTTREMAAIGALLLAAAVVYALVTTWLGPPPGTLPLDG